MVKKLSSADKSAIDAAIAKAKDITLTKINVVVLPLSDRYHDFVLFYGIMLGSTISLALWAYGVTTFPWLLAVQLGVIIFIDLVPQLRDFCVWLVPRRVLHQRSKEIARREYAILHGELSKDAPFVLLFVSLAEQYVHVITNSVVHAKVPEKWDTVTNHFVSSIRTEGLRTTCIRALDLIAEILAPHFPKA